MSLISVPYKKIDIYCTHTHAFLCVYLCVYVCTCVCVLMFVYLCVCICGTLCICPMLTIDTSVSRTSSCGTRVLLCTSCQPNDDDDDDDDFKHARLRRLA